MAVTVSRSDAQVLASLIFDDIRGYSARHAEAYAEFLAYKKEMERKQAANMPAQKRRSA
jgi:hypothetical protein